MANLVENENPTSMHSIPINDDMLPNVDSDNLDNLTSFNNMKGSYNNLFCDTVDEDPTIQTLDQREITVQQSSKVNQIENSSAQLLENVYCNISPVKQPQPQSQQQQSQSQRNSNYFNDTSTVMNATNSIVDNILNKSDPNLHVYSNVNSPTIGQNELLSQSIGAAKSIGNRTSIHDGPTIDPSSNLIKNHLNNENLFNTNIESILNKSSKLLSDDLNDLDLDDPTIAGSIVNTPITNTGTMSKVLKSNMNTSASDKISLSKKLKQTNSGDDLRSSATTSSAVAKNLFNDNNTTTTANADINAMIENSNTNDNNQSFNGSSSSFFNSQRLRSLHDNTMIDTALDLDSLEDTNIGIGTQACLTNTTPIH